jgi:hypothetical protein
VLGSTVTDDCTVTNYATVIDEAMGSGGGSGCPDATRG